ncbi:putative glycogen debranching enzyme [Methanohalophilus levihalophilus]|uniref:amylo-alpha-1,6-glucosidase n=1 Tax=Methanohalophilus levihalophilus TaxID=1431282 RepID=UPI001AE9C3EF|nr:amylo-alpha-1,6-glucosidase [Methanohalophilus levihalophilus]MBP2030685.1 putative glycogen debranching enzyme [Methanohalophilus levihalophilus]
MHREKYDYGCGIEREWLVTNGIGGYASSTVIGSNTRKYHGLLVASLKPPVDRRVLLSSLDEEITCGNEVYRFSVHEYPGVVYPEGFRHLHKFSSSPIPVFEYHAGNIKVEKSIFMVHGENTTVVQYAVFNPEKEKINFRIFPLVTDRDFHAVKRERELSFPQSSYTSGVYIGSNTLDLKLDSNLHYCEMPQWYYNFEYCAERERGQAFEEDLFNPGYFDLELQKDVSHLYVVASTQLSDGINEEYVKEAFARELERQKNLITSFDAATTFLQKLVKASDSFIVKRGTTGECSIIAGYHWFADWGRDTMISLPGLTLATGRFDDARNILITFSKNRSRGLIPNSFPDNPVDLPSYNSADASLWFIHTVGRYYSYTEDTEFVREIFPAIEDIIENYRKGTSFGIAMDDDGLIGHGGQLTWMDAKIGEHEITPRRGKACEINALWYNALCTASLLAEIIGEDPIPYDEISKLVRDNYEKQYWNPAAECLYDCIGITKSNGNEKDASVRPNQIFAVSLPFTMLKHKKEKLVLKKVTEKLLTPCGLRTLSPDDIQYMGKYGGDQVSRDMAYHNGTVWPWLMGPYVSAHTKVHNKSKPSIQHCRELLLNFDPHLDDAGIGSISELFDGDYPHKPGGCISQAWSVAEILRAWVEDLDGL